MGLFDQLFNNLMGRDSSQLEPTSGLKSSQEYRFQNAKKKPIGEDDIEKGIGKTKAPKDIQIAKIGWPFWKEHIRTVDAESSFKMVFYCEMYPAIIYCHSVLIDKLGDLTKFILSSIYKGHDLEEISSITNMGKITINEELDYLIRGGLVSEDGKQLTELGNQYGRLLEAFSSLSAGIPIYYNTFSGAFESADSLLQEPEIDNDFVLKGQFNKVLARNDNYANSLTIAKEKINADIPFKTEVSESLYTTVRIQTTNYMYKRVCINNVKAHRYNEGEPCIRLAIPFDIVTYKPLKKFLDRYRDTISIIESLKSEFPELLSNEAVKILKSAEDENNASLIQININAITTEIIHNKDNLIDYPVDPNVFVIEGPIRNVEIDDETKSVLNLKMMDRTRLYEVINYPYKFMEK